MMLPDDGSGAAVYLLAASAFSQPRRAGRLLCRRDDIIITLLRLLSRFVMRPGDQAVA